MFPYILIVLSIGTGEPPEPIASFNTESNCGALVYLLNRGFEAKDISKKAICIRAMKEGEV